MAQSNNILEKRWQRIVSEKHRKRLKETKSKLKRETILEYDDEEAQIQLRFRKIMAEEERQAIIDKQNSKLLQRIVDIMASKKKTFPVASEKELQRKVSKSSVTNDSKPKARHSSVKLPTITPAVKERRASK